MIHGFTISVSFYKLHVFLVDRIVVVRSRKEVMVKLKTVNRCQQFQFISILCIKQQSSIIWCFCNLKFESSICDNKLFRCTFRSKRIAYKAETQQVKFLVQNLLVKMTSFYLQTAFLLCCYCHIPFKCQSQKWSNTVKQFGNLPTNCLSVLDHFVKLALKGLSYVT